jgi:hypothetical protein
MKALVLVAGAVATILLCQASIAEAQDCKRCAREMPSVRACMKCVVEAEGDKYSLKQRTHWCTTNQPVCYQGKKKK